MPGTQNEVGAGDEAGHNGLGYIWDAALAAHLTVRNYGFFVDLGASELGQFPPTLTDPFATKTQVAFSAHPALLNRTDPYFRSFDQSFPDFFRYQEWSREFDNYVKHNNLPSLELLRFNHDHFGNFSTASFGVNTPELQIADDDYAVGLAIDKIAHSPYANSTLIFVIEDDPQDGADHVSGQRSVGLVVGPYVKQNAVVSTHYTTVNMLRTIEDVLGTNHLSIHDSGVAPMTDAFDTTQATWTYSAIPSLYLFNTTLPILNKDNFNLVNVPKPPHDAAWWAAQTKGFDFSEADRIDSDKFNRILWKGLKGGQPYPATRSGTDLRHPVKAPKSGAPQPDTKEISRGDGTN